MTAPASGRNRSRPAATCRRCNFRIIACSGIRTARRRSVKNGAGLLANPPRFLPLLAGPSFHGSGIGPESFAAKRGGKDASGTSRKHRSLRSPLEAVLNRRILACSGERTTDSPRARSGRLHSLVLAAPAQRGPEVVPAKATCGWFWVPFATKSTTNPQNGQISVVVLTIRLFFVSVRPVEAFEWPAGGIVERGLGFQNVTLFGNASHFIKR